MCAAAPCNRRRRKMGKEIKGRFACAVANAMWMRYHYHGWNPQRHKKHTPYSENGARPSPSQSLVGSSCSTQGLIATKLRLCLSLLLHRDLASNRCIDCELEHFMHARHFFATTFDICGAHLARDVLALLCGHWRETLGSEKLDTRSFITQI